jgi:pantoate--beta-alanine ligase
MPSPELPIVRTVAELRQRVRGWRAQGHGLGLVPTMGALHEGHLSLVRRARQDAARVLASVFVNPSQFAPGEDFERYPRDEAGDAALLASAGCDLLYAPGVGEIYPPGFSTSVTVAGVSEPLDGIARPTHFAGVATVVAKLLIQAEPDLAVFGEKDYQQLQVIRRLVRDLDLPVRIIGAPTVRDADGLALSSRNAYLSEAQRRIAAQLNVILGQAAEALAQGAAVAPTEARAVQALLDAGFEGVDYVEVRGAEDLRRLGPGPVDGPARLLAAARLGKTRLIDNMAVGP